MKQQRRQLIDTALQMNALGINQGSSGNVSLRSGDSFLITPTGMRSFFADRFKQWGYDLPANIYTKVAAE